MAAICFISYEIHPTTAGGCGVLIHHAAEMLLARGHDVVLLLDLSEYYFRKFVDVDRKSIPNHERLRAYRVDDLCADFPFAQCDIPSIFQWKSLRFAHALREVRKREPLGFVEFFEYCGPGYYTFVERLFEPEAPDARAKSPSDSPVLGSRIHGSIEVLDRHGDGLVRDVDHFIQHSFERRALALAETVLAPSRTYYERYYRPIYDLPPERIVISSPPKQPFPPVTRRPSASEEFTIAFVGRLFHLKGVDQLVHACVMLMKRRPNLRFNVDLIGYDAAHGPMGQYSAYLRTLIPARLRDRFIFAGQLSHEAIASRLDSALFAVFPNRVESFCYALHEVYDAGVPVIANALPAFADFFRHENNALLYDGTTQSLLLQMERLIDDEPLRTRLCRPYAVGEQALGEFYEAPTPAAPLLHDSDASPAHISPTLIVILCDSEDVAGNRAIASLAGADPSIGRVVALVPAHPESEETLWWLGRAWSVRDAAGNSIEASDVRTSDSIAIIYGTDDPDPTWLFRCRLALRRRKSLSFAGCWTRRGDRIQAGFADLAPELLAFTPGASMPRVVVRTPPDQLLSDLFEPGLGSLGFVGFVWASIGRHGHGVLLPEALLDVSEATAPSPTSAEVKALLLRHGSIFGDRLAIVAGLLADDALGAFSHPHSSAPLATAVLPTNGDVPLDYKVALADELGGRLLARMAWQKLTRRMRPGAPESAARIKHGAGPDTTTP